MKQLIVLIDTRTQQRFTFTSESQAQQFCDEYENPQDLDLCEG